METNDKNRRNGLLKHIVKYIKDVHNIFSYKKIVASSLVVFALLITLDLLDKIFVLFTQYFPLVLFAMIFSIILLIVSEIKNRFLFTRAINKTDFTLNLLLFVFLFLFLGSFLGNYYNLFIFRNMNFIYLTLMVVFILIVIVKAYFRAKHKTEFVKEITLSDFLDDSVIIKEGEEFVFVDVPSKKDCFGRETFCEELKYYVNLKKDSPYVILVDGIWGEGKTTIINNVIDEYKQNKKEYYVIDDFDPLEYNDSKSMLKAFLQSLYAHIGLNSFLIDKKIDEFINNHLNGNRIGVFHDMLSSLIDFDEFKLINEVLEKKNKQIIYVIDNVDRATKDNILLLMKMIPSIIKIKKITYIFSFERKKVNEILINESYEDNYLDKIVNKTITLNPIDIEGLNYSFIDAIKRFGQMHNVNLEKDFDIKKVRSLSLFRTPRDVVVFLNNIQYLFREKGINIVDNIFVQYLAFNNMPLLNLVKDNYELFIFSRYDDDKNKINRMKAIVDTELQKHNNEKYREILYYLFPCYEDRIKDHYFYAKEYEEEYKKRYSISLFDYFHLYTNHIFRDEIIFANKKIFESMKKINNGASIETSFSEIKLFENSSKSFLYLLKIKEHLDLLKDEYIVSVVKHLVENCNRFKRDADRNSYFLNIDIVSKLIERMDCEKFDLIKSYLFTYDKLIFSQYILHNLKDNKTNIPFYNTFNNLFDELVEKAINGKIDIFSEENFSHYNIRCFLNKLKRKEYFKSIVNKDNVLCFIKEFILKGYTLKEILYDLDKDFMKEMVDIDYIKGLVLLIGREELNEEDAFALKIFDKADFGQDNNNNPVESKETIREQKEYFIY